MTGHAVSPHHALGQAIGLTAFTWGYPLVESLRTCVLQTAGPAHWQAPIDRLHLASSVATDTDRDVVTPANDLLYCTGWINLANGPRRLAVPSPARHDGRYFVLAFYDAWTNNFENAGWRTSPTEGETLLLVGPDAGEPGGGVADGARVVRSPTNLVWLIGRVVAGPDDLPAARALLAQITLHCEPGTDSGRLPAAVQAWQGPPEDPIDALQANPDELAWIADRFFCNLCRSLADQAAPAEDAGLVAWLATAGLRADPRFDTAQLDPQVRAGLRQGMADAVAWLTDTASASNSRRARGWATNFRLGRYGTRYQARALTAYQGLGALAAEEAVYARTDCDARHQPLDGRQACTMRFEPGDPPPAQAFWSVTLYAQDRFLYPNPLARHSIGDRTAGLQADADGGLTLRIGHAAPADAPGHPESNWLPAPAGPYYLVLRLYGPGAGARTWRIPPLQPES